MKLRSLIILGLLSLGAAPGCLMEVADESHPQLGEAEWALVDEDDPTGPLSVGDGLAPAEMVEADAPLSPHGVPTEQTAWSYGEAEALPEHSALTVVHPGQDPGPDPWH